MSELPHGWTRTTLSEIGDYLNGRGFKKSEWRESGRPIIRIQNLTGSSDHFNYFDGPAEESYIAREGDLLVSWAATLGVFTWRGPEAVVNQHIFKVESHIDSGFHHYLLLSVLTALQRQTHGSGMVHITKAKFDETPIALPPLNEQRRIVAAIDEQLSRLDAADACITAAIRRLGRFRSGILENAFARNAPTVEIGSIATVGSGATPKRGRTEYWRGGTVPWVTSGQINEQYIRAPAELITEEALRETNVKLWPQGTLLVALYGEGQTRGRCAELTIEATTNQACAAIVLNEDIADRVYVRRFFDAHYVAHRRLAFGGVQPNLSLGLIRSLRIPLPPLAEQRSVVAKLEEQLSAIDALRAAIDRTQRRSASLRRAVLERAFRGRLVPQDQSDESAAALLERVRTERADASSRPRRRRAQA